MDIVFDINFWKKDYFDLGPKVKARSSECLAGLQDREEIENDQYIAHM